MIWNLMNSQRSSTTLPQYFSNKRNLFQQGMGHIQASKPASNLGSLAAVFERSPQTQALIDNQKQIYKHPLASSSHDRNPITQATKSYAEWNKNLIEQSKEYVENFKDELKKRKTAFTTADKEKLQKKLNAWLNDQRNDLTKRLNDAPQGLSKKLLDTSDKTLGRLGNQIWSDMDAEIVSHNDAVIGKPQDPWSGIKNLTRDIVEWNKSLKVDSKEFVNSFKAHLDSLPGRFSDEDLKDMREELDTWLEDRRNTLADRLEDVPDFISKRIMEIADRRLERFDDKMWKDITRAVKRHNDSIPPVDPGNPMERANQIYDEWNKSLGESTEDYLESFDKALDEWAGVFTDENKQDMEQQLSDWITSQRDNLEKSMAELPHGIVKQQLKKAEEYLSSLQDDLLNKLRQSVGLHNNAVLQAQQSYNDWNDSLDDLSKDYFDTFKQNLSGLNSAVTDEQKEQMRQGLLEWLQDQRGNLQDLLETAPSGFSKLLLEHADHNLGELNDQLWKLIEEAINKHNQSIPNRPPVEPPGHSFPPGSVFTPGTTTRIEVGAGDRRVNLKLEDITSQNRGKSLFYVVDALGNRKGVSITFNNELLQKEFEKRFKASSMYGKTVSLEKFNDFLKKFKKSLGDINDSDLERIKDKLTDKKATADFDKLVNDFISLLKKTKL